MSWIDLIQAFKNITYVRFDNKTIARSIKKQDSGNSLRDLADLLLMAKPTDENKSIAFNQQQSYTINWQSDIVPGTSPGISYYDFFGNFPKFTISINSSPEISGDNSGIGISRTYSDILPNGTLTQIDFDFGPFLTDGIIIIS